MKSIVKQFLLYRYHRPRRLFSTNEVTLFFYLLLCCVYVFVCQAVLVEYVEVFDTKESMGMKLSNSLVIIGFGTSKKNVISLAEAKGTIRPGDKIISLNNENVVSSSLNDFVKLLQKSKLPRELKFRGERNKNEILQARSFFSYVHAIDDDSNQQGVDSSSGNGLGQTDKNGDDRNIGSRRITPVYRVTFSNSGLIGLQFAGNANSTVMGFSRSATNAMREAEKKNIINPGDVLLSVNGVEVDRKTLMEMIEIVEKSPSPRVLTFTRIENSDGSHGGSVKVGKNGGESYSIMDFEHVEITTIAFPDEGKLFRALRATFGSLPPCDRLPLILSNPTNGCGDLINTGQISGSYVAMTRGQCSFTTKARIAQDSGAIGLIVVNSQSKIVRMPYEYGEDITDIKIPVVMVEHDILKMILHSTSLNSEQLYGKLVVSKECSKGGKIMDAKHTHGNQKIEKGKHLDSHGDGSNEDEMDNDDDDTTVKYMMHGGSTIFVSPKYIFNHGSDGGILSINSPPTSLISEWNERGIDVISTGYGPKIVPFNNGILMLSNDLTGCSHVPQYLNGRDNVILVIAEWNDKCNFLQRIQNIENSGAAVALFTYKSNYIHSIGHFTPGMNQIKSKTELQKLGLSHPYSFRIPTLLMTKHAGEALVKYLKLRGNVHLINDAMISPDFHLKEKWLEVLKLQKPQFWPNDENARRKLYFRLLKVHGEEVSTGSHDRHVVIEESYRESEHFWKTMKKEHRFADL